MTRILAIALLLGVLVSPALAEDKKSLYDRLGGVGPISVVVDEFINRMVVNEALNKNPAIRESRDRVPAPFLKFHVTAMVCQATGGPCKYTGRDMKTSHAKLNISEKDWAEMAKVFKEVLDKFKVPAKEQQELFAIVGTTKADIVIAGKAPAKK